MDEGAGRSRERVLKEGRLAQYAEKARGAIYWEATDRRGVSPLELVRRAAIMHPGLFDRALRRLTRIDRAALEYVVTRVPEGWMSGLSRTFAVELMCYTLQELMRIAP